MPENKVLEYSKDVTRARSSVTRVRGLLASRVYSSKKNHLLASKSKKTASKLLASRFTRE